MVVKNKILSIQQIFLWGGVEEREKVPRVKWETVLGIRNVRVFDRALLCVRGFISGRANALLGRSTLSFL